jgi:hypothetical protein
MPMLHKYQQHDFKNEFQTHNSILDTVPYEPEVIFIGSYNHGWSWNSSDFYYGRDMYMWTVLGNIFQHGCNHLVKQRTINNNEPTFNQLFDICKKGKIVFADIVKGINENITAVELENEKCVLVNNQYRWESIVINNQKVGEYSDTHLENLARNHWLDDNVNAIKNFVNETKSIKHIYFTFKSGVWLVKKLHKICQDIRRDVSYCSIFTPTANGFGGNLLYPFNERAWGLTHCWIWNGLNHKSPINRPNYGHLDHDWLIDKGVYPNNF